MRDLIGRARRRWAARNQPDRRFAAVNELDPAVLRCSIAYNRYGGYCVPLSSAHRPAAQTILAGEVYEPETISFITARCVDGDVVHAGTYFGDFLPALSLAMADDACVWAFEPNEENYRCALVTLALNSIQNVRLTHAALDAREGTAALAITGADGRSLGGTSHLVATATEPSAATETVVTTALDDVLPPDRRVSVVHLDVEGHEKAALEGALRTVRSWKPILILESIPDRRWFDEMILALGYTPRQKLHTNSVFICD